MKRRILLVASVALGLFCGGCDNNVDDYGVWDTDADTDTDADADTDTDTDADVIADGAVGD